MTDPKTNSVISQIKAALEAMEFGEWKSSSRCVVEVQETEDWPRIPISIHANRLVAPRVKRYLLAIQPANIRTLLQSIEADDQWNKNKTWPVGTNLFTADQARKMIEHIFAAPSPAPSLSPPPAPVEPVAGVQAVHWLIECKNSFVGWWNGETQLSCPLFDTDPNKAVRFARKEDAEKVINRLGNSCMVATAHQWLATPPAPVERERARVLDRLALLVAGLKGLPTQGIWAYLTIDRDAWVADLNAAHAALSASREPK